MKYNIDEILNKVYAKENESVSADSLNSEVMGKIDDKPKAEVNGRNIGKMTRYAVVIAGACLVLAIVISVCFIVKPNVDKKSTESAPVVDNNVEENSKNTDEDYISSIYYNQTWKYDSEEIGCEVYEWTEDIVLPIPKPEGESSIEIIHGTYQVLGIDKSEWDNYVELLDETYEVVRTDSELNGYLSCGIRFYNMEKNIVGYLSWGEYSGIDNLENCFEGFVFVGSNYKNTNLSNEEVLNKVFSKLEYDNKEGFSIVNVNSKTNYKDGFDVYLVETSMEYAYANEYTYEYICVLRNDEIVLLEPCNILIGLPAAVEFVQVGDSWRAYITEYNGKSGLVGNNLLEYNMVDGFFVENELFDISEFVSLIKKDNMIEVYRVLNKGLGENIPNYAKYKLGDKIYVIDEEGVKKVE